MRKLLMICIIGALMLGLSQIAEAGVVVSWNSSIQRGGDLDGASTNSLGYSAFEAGLESRGHTVLPGIGELTSANLAGVDLFFHGTNSHILSASEQTAISDFVQNGGCVLVEANSPEQEKASGNSLLTALGLGSPYNGTNGGSDTPQFTNNDTWTTNGPVGDVRGLSFGLTLTADITIGGGTLVATYGSINAMVEYEPYGASGGRVLVVGDPLGFNLFQRPGDPEYSPNVQTAYINFLESQLEDEILTVEVDIKGGSCPNPFNPKSKGSVPVAIVGSEDFDVTTIDPSSICLIGPDGMACALEGFEIEDSTQPSDSDPADCYDCFDADVDADGDGVPDLWCDLLYADGTPVPEGEVGDGVMDTYCGDGYMDLVVKFAVADLVAAIGEAERKDCVDLVLIGNLLSGRAITGGDSMLILKKINGSP